MSTAARICRSVGLNRLRKTEPVAVPVRYEKERSGELLHVDIKRLGRFDRAGHRITRKRSFGSKKQGFEFVYVATDDRSRRWFALQNVQVERVMTATDLRSRRVTSLPSVAR